MMKDPFGTTTISGQLSHSLKLSFGFSACSISGVSGCTPCTAKNCRGGGGAGVASAAGAGLGRTCLDFADALPDSEMASAVTSKTVSLFERMSMANSFQMNDLTVEAISAHSLPMAFK